MAKRPAAARRPAWPWDPVLLDPHEVSLLKQIDPAALAVLDKLCGVGRNPFVGGGEDGRRASDFASGKLWVGHTLRDARAMELPRQAGGPPPGLGPDE